MTERAVFSSDANDHYAFYLPLTSLLWSRRGYRPLILLVGEPERWTSDRYLRLAVARSREVGAEIHWLGEFDGVKSSTVAQISRLFGANVRGVDGDDFLLTADVDMWTLGDWAGSERDPSNRLHVWGANAYMIEGRAQYPICYIGGKAATWREIFGGGTIRDRIEDALSVLRQRPEFNESGRSDQAAWYFDETFAAEKIRAWDGYPTLCQEIPRTFEPGQGRIDRSGWVVPSDLAPYADAHLMRPGFGQNWDRIRPLLAQSVSASWVKWADEYHESWMRG